MTNVTADSHALSSQAQREERQKMASLLQLAPQLTPHAIEWLVEGDIFVIRGCVTSYYQKQLATTIARRLPGIERIVNELEVRPGRPRGETTGNDRS